MWPEILPWIDPWGPLVPKEAPLLPIFDPQPFVNVALGAALVTLRQAYPYPPEKFNEQLDEAAAQTALKGARAGLNLAIKHAAESWKGFSKVLKIN